MAETRNVPPASASSPPRAARRRDASGGVRTTEKAAYEPESVPREESRDLCGSAPRYPSGPASVAPSPSDAISARTRSAGSSAPHPGTSHTPHEIGPLASRWRVDPIRGDLRTFAAACQAVTARRRAATASAASPRAKAVTKLGTVAPRPQSGGSSLATASVHQTGPSG